MADRTCEKCGAVFSHPCRLRTHRNRKTPCEPILAVPKSDEHQCQHCGRGFKSSVSKYRHIRESCKAANSGEAREPVSLQQQVATMQVQTAGMKAQLDELTALLRDQYTFAPGPGALATPRDVPPRPGAHAIHIRNQAVQITNVQQNIQVVTRPWSECPINLTIAVLREAFTENPLLAEYCRLTDAEKADAKTAAPYIAEALVDLVRRTHAADPTTWNIVLNPHRADQALVYERGWEVRAAPTTLGTLFDKLAGRIREITLSAEDRAQLPFSVQAAAAWLPLLYADDREGYVARARARAPMAAHLANQQRLVGAAQ